VVLRLTLALPDLNLGGGDVSNGFDVPLAFVVCGDLKPSSD